ncbi:hypothetical protein FPZ43_10720 [Mucilaginibacter pallidiroseus]|uniref:Outer membrane protein beta-barrel domain-containing protein n=1 Tax=Mucilaginibacter pallidiroseus TaxID=2599295 RepID=A0A563UDH9_9SPHI|nr:outer membrane beta-barrel protein [Mucilaginibacter pallidiroseus]TWR29415.1 hypothetical protein FPZ43_10720 [Mucilaginibacter pallidiroseus]
MKRVLLLLTVICGFSMGAFAQSGSRTGKWNIGLEPALPLGNLKSVYSFALGASVKYELPVASSTFITFSADYQRFFIKSDLKDALNSVGIDKSGVGIIPVKVGVKTYFDQGFFAEAQVGAGFSTEEGGSTSFVYAPGIGYTFTSGFEAGLKYQGYSSDGANDGVLALRLAYRF